MTEPANLLHHRSSDHVLWTTANVGEAAPGVLVPMAWSVWSELGEGGLRAALVDLGAYPPSWLDLALPTDERFTAIFFGRYAANVNTFRAMSDRVPGASGDALETSFFGEKLSTQQNRPFRRRYPLIAARTPVNVWRSPRAVRRLRASNYRWWSADVAARPPRGVDAGVAVVRESIARFRPTMRAHQMVTLLAQGMYERVQQLCVRTGLPGLEQSLMSGYGGMEEAAVVGDLHAVSRGALAIEEFVLRHGYHGPSEGDVSSRSWRDDHAPVRLTAASYQEHAVDPLSGADRARSNREAAERALFAKLSALQRPNAEAVLKLARQFTLSREVGKAAFLLAMDGIRAGARGAAPQLVDRGVLAEPEDVFFLTLEELVAAHNLDHRERAAERRAWHSRYAELDVPETWQGNPVPVPVRDAIDEPTTSLVGTGVSAGRVRGRVAVVTASDSAEADAFEPGDILVCRVTDPSWAPLLSVAGALVVDIGGPMSHAAMIARELGVPCVVNIRRGTRVLRTGNTVEIDGSTGAITTLS